MRSAEPLAPSSPLRPPRRPSPAVELNRCATRACHPFSGAATRRDRRPGPPPPARRRPAAAAPSAVVTSPRRRAVSPVAARLRRRRPGAARRPAADAERRFRSLAQAHPELPGPHANLGLIQRQAGKLPEAVAELETAVKLSPRQPVYWNQLGVTYRQAGQFAKAREAYEKAIALDPGYSAAVLNLGILHDLYLNDGARALDLYGRYLMLQPSGDATVTKWVADLKNRKPAPITVSRKEKE